MRLNADISGQSDAALVNIAERAGLLRDHQLARACSDDLYRRIYELHLGRGAGGVNMQLGSAESFLETCAYDRTKPAWAIDFISDYRDRGDSVWMLRAYCKGLFRISGALQLREVLAAELTPREREVAVDYAVRLAVRASVDLRDAFTREEDRSDPYVSVYRWLRGADPGEVTQSTGQRDAKWLQLEEYEQYDQTIAVESNYRRSFWSFLANHLWGREDVDQQWLTEVGQESWPKAFLALLHEVAGELAQLLRENQPPPLAWLYGRLSTFARPKWPEDRDVHWYGNCAAKVINRLGLDILYLNADVSKRSIGRADLEAAFESKYFVPVLWTEFYLNERDPLLNDGALDWLLTMLSAELEHSIDQFNERAQRYSVLAGIAALHGRAEATKDLIHRTAYNIFTYGDHKDVLLFGILECIEACHNAGIAEARDWLVSLAPVIAEVGEFTDGDETGGLPREYGDVMARIAPDLLPHYHRWLVANEEYYDALSVFHSFIRHAALSDPISKAIAATAIDDESIVILADRTASGDPGSAEVFAELAKRYGHNHESIERIRASLDRSSGSTGLSKKEFPSAAEYPPGHLQDYIASCKPEYDLWVKECVEQWLTYWIAQDRLLEVYNEYTGILATGTELGNEDLVHNLVLRLLGKDYAYPWLVKAHREGHGWNRYWTSKDKAVRRWELIKHYYPEKWFDFIVDTSMSESDVPWQPLGFYERFERLTEYCVFVGQIDLAKRITQRVIEVLFGLVSPLTLPTPEWVHQS